MNSRSENWIERILLPATKRLVAIVAACAIAVAVSGCQSGNCKTCLFGSRDKDKEVIDSTQLGQDKDQEKPTPPKESDVETLKSQESTTPPVAIKPTPKASDASDKLASSDEQRIPNAAAPKLETSDPAALRPSLDALPDANGQAQNFSSEASDSGVSPSFREVAPADSGSLGFAPSTGDHSASLAPETKNDASSAPLPPEFFPQSSAEASAKTSESTTLEPPAESATPDPANKLDGSDDAANFEDRLAIESAYDTRRPTLLKGEVRARYVDNAAAGSVASERAAKKPASAGGADSSRFVPNGQTSGIIPGMKLGVVDFSARSSKSRSF